MSVNPQRQSPRRSARVASCALLAACIAHAKPAQDFSVCMSIDELNENFLFAQCDLRI